MPAENKLPLDRWLFLKIVNHRSLAELMDVGNHILELKLETGYTRLLEAWERKWKPHFDSGQVGHAEHWHYHAVKRDLGRQRAQERTSRHLPAHTASAVLRHTH